MNLRTAYLATPLLVLAYGVIRILDGLDGSRGPGIAWTTGHLAFIAALALFIPIFLDMRRRLGGGVLPTVTVVAGIAGIACAMAQFVIDVIVGFMAADHAGMGVLFDRVQEVPGVDLLVYQGGPFLFYIAQFVLVTHLAVVKQVKYWTPVLVMLDFMLPLMNKDLMPLGALCLLVSFIPLARTAATPLQGRHILAA
ncbi:hypothetical protein ACIBHY_46970 [Nonomuraea sp. NPDC050547]|uniref:hypothetical protein n=1 Tax=unclassified Nonomuraea TaxID=2593643 RepID=UPI0037A24A85